MIWNQPGWDFKDVAKIFVRSGKGGGVEQNFRTKPFSHYFNDFVLAEAKCYIPASH